MTQRILVALLVVFALVSCTTDDDTMLRELAKNRELWEASNIENYSLNQRVSCFCAGPYSWTVFVKGKLKDKVEFDETQLEIGQTYDEIYEDVLNSARTVEEIFEFLERTINKEVASLRVEYNEEYGFPTLISIDYIENAVDDEIGYIYTDFNIEN